MRMSQSSLHTRELWLQRACPQEHLQFLGIFAVAQGKRLQPVRIRQTGGCRPQLLRDGSEATQIELDKVQMVLFRSPGLRCRELQRSGRPVELLQRGMSLRQIAQYRGIVTP